MVRGQEPVWRRTKPGRSMRRPAGLRVPCACTCALCASVPAWVGQFDGSLEMRSHLLQVPQEFISQDWIRPGLAKVQGVTDWQTNKRDRTCEAEAEGGCQCPAGALSPPSASSSAHGTHNTRTNPPTRIARFGRAGGAGCFPNLLSEHGLANTSSNESHHHDHDHATMSSFCLYLTISSQSSTVPTFRFLVSSSPKVPGLRLAWPGLAGCIGFLLSSKCCGFLRSVPCLWVGGASVCVVCKLISP